MLFLALHPINISTGQIANAAPQNRRANRIPTAGAKSNTNLPSKTKKKQKQTRSLKCVAKDRTKKNPNNKLLWNEEDNIMCTGSFCQIFLHHKTRLGLNEESNTTENTIPLYHIKKIKN